MSNLNEAIATEEEVAVVVVEHDDEAMKQVKQPPTARLQANRVGELSAWASSLAASLAQDRSTSCSTPSTSLPLELDCIYNPNPFPSSARFYSPLQPLQQPLRCTARQDARTRIRRLRYPRRVLWTHLSHLYPLSRDLSLLPKSRSQ